MAYFVAAATAWWVIYMDPVKSNVQQRAVVFFWAAFSTVLVFSNLLLAFT